MRVAARLVPLRYPWLAAALLQAEPLRGLATTGTFTYPPCTCTCPVHSPRLQIIGIQGAPPTVSVRTAKQRIRHTQLLMDAAYRQVFLYPERTARGKMYVPQILRRESMLCNQWKNNTDCLKWCLPACHKWWLSGCMLLRYLLFSDRQSLNCGMTESHPMCVCREKRWPAVSYWEILDAIRHRPPCPHSPHPPAGPSPWMRSATAASTRPTRAMPPSSYPTFPAPSSLAAMALRRCTYI